MRCNHSTEIAKTANQFCRQVEGLGHPYETDQESRISGGRSGHPIPAGDQSDAKAFYKRQPGRFIKNNADKDRRQHRYAEHHEQQPEYALHHRPVHGRQLSSDKGNTDLEQGLQALDLAAIGQEQNDMVVSL